jgi:hypothetical protein
MSSVPSVSMVRSTKSAFCSRSTSSARLAIEACSAERKGTRNVLNGSEELAVSRGITYTACQPVTSLDGPAVAFCVLDMLEARDT